MLKLLSLQFCLFFFIHNCIGQNLVRNSSFEDKRNCPESWNTRSTKKILAYEWYNANKGTPDYFHKCGTKSSKPNKNHGGSQNPLTGEAYIGLICYVMEKPGKFYREYISTKFEKKLKKGQLYCVKFHVSLADLSMYAISSLGVYFTTGKTRFVFPVAIIKVPQIENSKSIILDNDSSWVCIGGVYQAKGNEKAMIIGNFRIREEINVKFRYDSLIKTIPLKKIQKEAYYYIDDVSVQVISDSGECDCDSGNLGDNEGNENFIWNKCDVVKEIISLKTGF